MAIRVKAQHWHDSIDSNCFGKSEQTNEFLAGSRTSRRCLSWVWPVSTLSNRLVSYLIYRLIPIVLNVNVTTICTPRFLEKLDNRIAFFASKNATFPLSR